MTTVALGSDFLGAYARIPRAQQRKVRDFTENFKANPKSPGINYEKIHDVRDDKVRTVRIDQKYRAVVLHPGQGDVYILAWVDNHDEAMAWARNRVFEINPVTGALQIINVSQAEQVVPPKTDKKKTSGLLSQFEKDFQVKGQKFHITHVRLLAPQDIQHSTSFCAHKRSVKTELLTKHLPNLEAALTEPEGEKKFVYAGYVSSQLLDSSVNSERTRFDLMDQAADTVFAGELCWQDILEAAVAKAKEFLEPYTRPLNEAKKERIRKFVATEAPQYRPLLKHKVERIDALRSNLTDQQLDVELYQIGQEWDLELRAEYRKLLEEKDETATSQEAFRQRYETFLDDWNDSGISMLARYVVHRKATLDLLEERRGRKDDDKYHLEDAIHEIVFPLKKTTEDVRIENMNLWIIDEKLAYHFFLASDKPLNQIAEAIEVDSKERPDLLIFNRPFAFADADPPFSAIVIIEFKRPAKDDYSEKEEKNPILQVYDYIGLLKTGKAKDRRSVPISVPDHMPIYAYIVCDLTPTLQKQARDYQLTKTPDSLGYFGYHKEYGAYIEVISFDKLIDDAKRRNRILFERLGLHGEATPSR